MPAFESAWRKLLQEIVLAKNYPGFYLMIGVAPTTLIQHPILEQLLPTLLFVNLVSLFDEALQAHLDSSTPRNKLRTLEKRIDHFSAAGLFVGPTDALHSLRHRRNVLAHETGASATWAEVDAGVAVVGRELANLHAISAEVREPYVWFAEKSGLEESSDPIALFEERYDFGLNQENRPVLRFGLVSKILRSGHD